MTRNSNKFLGFGMLAVLAAIGGGAWARVAEEAPQIAGSSRHPIVVELFQSQGCSSCPPANAILNTLADRPDVLTLSFAVTYWDRLGWKDTFGAPEFTARQQDYAQVGVGQVATPEFIVAGKWPVVGSDRAKLATAIRNAAAGAAGPAISLSPGEVRVAAGKPARSAEVWLVRYDPRSRDVPVRAGENGGRTLPHRHIVRQLVRLGTWTGAAYVAKLPVAREAGLKTAVLLQEGNGGRIMTAAGL